MLTAIENHLLSALRAVHPEDLTITVGPAFPPSTTANKLLTVNASILSLRRPAIDEEVEDNRQQAFFMQSFTLQAGGSHVDFTLPNDAVGQVTEVQTPRGRIAQPGDDYRIEGRVIQFYRAPQQDVVVRTRGERSRGYQQRQPCQIDIEIAVWAKNAVEADSLVHTSLSAALAAYVDLDLIEFANGEVQGISFRLLKPAAELHSIERSIEKGGNANFIHSMARLYLRGELELILALGVLAPEGVIEEIEYSSQVGGAG